MAVNLSPYGGVGAQFLDNAGNVLTGGKIETYAAGTTVPQATYTSSVGVTFHPNPIILDASGRVPSGGEIWLTDGLAYKFVLKDSNNVLIATYDNITGINSNFVNFVNQQEIQTATAGQTVFTLTTTQYQPGTNSLSVFVDGVNQYGPGAQYAYLETNSTTVTFVNGLHVGAEVKFTTSQLNSSGATAASQVSFTGFKGQTGTVQDLADDDGSDWIGFEQAGTSAVARSAQDKMRDIVSVKDFGAVGDGVADDTVAIQNAKTAAHTGDVVNFCLYFPAGAYRTTSTIDLRRVMLDASEAQIVGDHTGIVLLLGGRAQNPNNPWQKIRIVSRSQGVDNATTPTVRIIGAKGQNISIERAVYVQFYADSDDSNLDGSIGYSNFYLRYCDTVELTNNPTPIGSLIQWINENQFYLNRISTLLVNGTYEHNHNNFWNGSFENSAVITFNTGRSNFVYNTRFENGATVTFDANATDCVVVNSWTSSTHRYPTGNITVVNNGLMCSVLSAYDNYYPLKPYVGFSYESLKKVGLDYNVQGVSNIAINATNLTVASNQLLFTSTFIPVSGAEQSVFSVGITNNTNGIRIAVDGYDATKTLIAPAANQVFYDGVGFRQFQQADAAVNNSAGRNFFITDSTCVYVKIRVFAGGAALTFDTFRLSIRANSPSLSALQDSWLLTTNNFV